MKRLTVCLTLLLLTGCIEKKTLEEVELIQSFGFDQKGEDIQITATAPFIQQNSQPGAFTETFTTLAKSPQEAREQLQNEAPRPFENGKLQVVVMNKELGEKGLGTILESLQEDSKVGRSVFLAMTRGDAKDILYSQYAVSPIVSSYLKDLIEKSGKTNYPKVNFHDYLYSYYGAGMDPVLPIIKKVGDRIRMDGLACFRGDTYVTSLPPKDVFIFKTLYEKVKRGYYQFSFKNNTISVEEMDISSDYRVTLSSSYDIHIHVSINGYVREASGIKINRENVNKIEKGLKTEMEKKANNIIAKLQKHKSDPLRIGDTVRSKDRKWKEAVWDKQYPNAQITAHYHVKLNSTGVIEY
ncbi:Ger(x)C family spore germination protein [Fictibacillus iocasae]|uniref:Ger(X)C family spore germination protein n=1 Tax=Fictibacillus iocasae TaxID=2715437 RepID=A0ABW2NPG2_9BACL